MTDQQVDIEVFWAIVPKWLTGHSAAMSAVIASMELEHRDWGRKLEDRSAAIKEMKLADVDGSALAFDDAEPGDEAIALVLNMEFHYEKEQ